MTFLLGLEPYHLKIYGPQAGPFSLWFSKETDVEPYQLYDHTCSVPRSWHSPAIFTHSMSSSVMFSSGCLFCKLFTSLPDRWQVLKIQHTNTVLNKLWFNKINFQTYKIIKFYPYEYSKFNKGHQVTETACKTGIVFT